MRASFIVNYYNLFKYPQRLRFNLRVRNMFGNFLLRRYSYVIKKTGVK
jgi:hypothetical protein